jgi:hypothetical protein
MAVLVGDHKPVGSAGLARTVDRAVVAGLLSTVGLAAADVRDVVRIGVRADVRVDVGVRGEVHVDVDVHVEVRADVHVEVHADDPYAHLPSRRGFEQYSAPNDYPT